MTWLDKLERRFGFLGIPGLIRIVIGFTALVWALMWLNPNFRFALGLDPARIRHGERWWLFTYILFILPVKIKWLAWIFAAFLLVGFVLNSNSYRAALIAAFANYFIFFGPEIIHQARHRQEVSTRRRRFEAHSRSDDEALHRCAVCGATELTDPNLDFRVARDGEEYCIAHLPKAQTSG